MGRDRKIKRYVQMYCSKFLVWKREREQAMFQIKQSEFFECYEAT